jgi:hypothetical protein
VLILIEKRVIKFYEYLIQLAAQDRYKDKDFLEVVAIIPIDDS